MARKSNATQDDRFSASSYDPRFIVPSTKKNKVKVDERFSKEELRRLNTTATGKKAKVDRYGRAVKEGHNEDFEKYFEEEGKVSDGESNQVGSESESSDESDDSSSESDSKEVESRTELKEDANDESSEEEEEQAYVDRARGEGLQSESDSDSDDSDSDDLDEESEAEIETKEERPEEGDPTATFAVVNMDWDNVKAVDLLSTFASFVPKGGNIISVTIYPSEYGKEQMQKEEVEGPPRELFKIKKRAQESDSDSDEDLDLTNKEDLEKATRKLYEEDDGEQDYDSKALRRYQLQRLRYYYAVVRCDSVSTAQSIYKNCDGSEYESTANIFDLRYVPEGTEFEEHEAKEVCTKIPSSYRPDFNFVTDALQHSKVKLTWDETPKERMSLSTRSFSQKEIDDMDFKAYLASDSEGSDNEAAGLKNKYKHLLGKSFSSKDQDGDSEGEVDMEITFNPGLDERQADLESKPETPKEETTIEAYRRKEKERRLKRAEKYQKKLEEEKKDESSSSVKGKRTKGKRDSAQQKSREELELLMLDEDADNKSEHFNMRDIIKAEKNRKNKRKGNKNYDDNMVQDNFKADLDDDRFQEIFENHEFAIDPTSSEFKKTNTMKQILKERGKRSAHGNGEVRKKRKHAEKAEGSALNDLVKKLKQKK